MLLPMSPTSSLFLLAETRNQPMHVASLQLFEPPDGADALDVRRMLDEAVADAIAGDDVNQLVAPLFRKRPRRSVTSLGQWGWELDDQFDLEYHVRRSALPKPGRILELLTLCSRLHSSLLDRRRPMWEMHLVEGLADGRYAIYFKVHHSVVDGVTALKLLGRTYGTDPDERNMPAPWTLSRRPNRPPRPASDGGGPGAVIREALALAGNAAGMGPALVRTVGRALSDQTGTVSLSAPKSMFNVEITGARRFAAQSWPIDRIRRVGKASDTTVNDVVLAMCSGALRRYMLEQDALPDSSLIAMVPVSLHGRGQAPSGDSASESVETEDSGDGGGNAVGVVMCRLGTDRPDAADRLTTVHRSMVEGKAALSTMTPTQILAMSALGVSPLGIWPALGLTGSVRPPFNLVISNVPGPREPIYWNGARLDGLYPLSIPLDGQALNITCTSYSHEVAFGLTGCRRSVPRLQRLLIHLDEELSALELAVGL